MKINRICLASALAVVLALTLTGCMNSGSRGVQNAATQAPDYMPGTNGDANVDPTAIPAPNGAGTGADGSGMDTGSGASTGNTSGTSNGALTPFDWANGAAQIESAIARISEIGECRVAVTNTTALVGVKYDNAYKGQLTERIREMVAAEVLKADPSIQTVAVTSDPEDVKKVYEISDAIRAGRPVDELSAQINAIVRNATTMR